MKLSIWSQFTSNHSANFTVIGAFETAEKAQQAADEIGRLLTGIAGYYAVPENKEKSFETLDGGGPLPLTPAELEFYQRYGLDTLDWVRTQGGIDWIDKPGDVDKAVHVFEDLAFVDNPLSTWQGPMLMIAVLKTLGGKVGASVNEWGHLLLLNIACLAPDEAAAEAIVRELNRALDDSSGVVPAYGDGFPTMYSGSVSRDGRRIRLNGATFAYEAWKVLPSLVEELRSRGCTAIQYEYVEEKS